MRIPIIIAGLILWGMTASAANQGPRVNAGEDQLNGSTGAPSYLIGEVSDDATPYESLEIVWSQISGPAQAQIQLPTSATTGVSFPDSGLYVFELSVSDGTLTSRDSAMVRVRRNLPFRLLAPSENERIQIGKPYVIRWQMDPSIPCTVWFTIDNGLNWVMLTDQGSVTDSFVWEVPDTFKAEVRGGIKVHEYMNASNEAQGSGEFVFTDGTHVIGRGKDPHASFLKTSNFPTEIYSLTGRRIAVIGGRIVGTGLLVTPRLSARERSTSGHVRCAGRLVW